MDSQRVKNTKYKVRKFYIYNLKTNQENQESGTKNKKSSQKPKAHDIFAPTKTHPCLPCAIVPCFSEFVASMKYKISV